MKSFRTGALLITALAGINLVIADSLNGLINKQQFNEIFPLSNGEHLQQLYKQYYEDFKQQQSKAAQAHDACSHLLAPNTYWNSKYQQCLDKAAPELERATANLNKLRGDFQNCPALIVTDAHGHKVDFSNEAPKPETIKTIKTLYTFENFAKTTQYFHGFLAGGDRHTAKRELAALLANVQQETTGLCFAAETPFDLLEKLSSPADFSKISNQQLAAWMNDEDKKALAAQKIDISNINDTNRSKVINYVLEIKRPKGKYCKWDSEPGKEKACLASPNYYYGRGAIQLSYPYNYIAFGNSEFVKKHGYDLLAEPGLVADLKANQPDRSSLLWGSAIWFWMTPQSPKPSAHAVMTNQWTPSAADIKNHRLPGFGTVINIINGGLECGSGRGADKDVKAQNRIDAYNRIMKIIGSSLDDNSKYPLDCKDSNNFNIQ